MRLEGNTILITGGSSGIGLALARRLADTNEVIICGRSEEKLTQAKVMIPLLHTFQCDIAQQSGQERLTQWIKAHHPTCNILVNNAAIVHKTGFLQDPQIIQKAQDEIQTNFIAPVALTKHFWPILSANQNSAVIYLTTGLVYAPKAAYPIYNATKSALHTFIRTLRMQTDGEATRLYEVLMPVVDTPFHNGHPPKIAISPEKAVDALCKGLQHDKQEIRIAGVKLLYLISRLSPALAQKIINRVQ